MPSSLQLCIDNTVLSIVIGTAPDLTKLTNYDSTDLMIWFESSDSSNPSIPSAEIKLDPEDYPLTEQFTYSTAGEYKYIYNIGIITNSIMLSSQCLLLIQVSCYETCKKCTVFGNKKNPQCTECYSDSFFDQDRCIKNCSTMPSYYYIDPLDVYVCINSIIACHDEYPFHLTGKKECVKKRPSADIPYTKLCATKCYDPYIINMFSDDCNCEKIEDYITDLISKVNETQSIIDMSKDNIIISNKNDTYHFSQDPQQGTIPIPLPNISTIVPGQLGKLREQCNIGNEETIIIRKKDSKIENGLTNNVEITYYYQNGNIINLEECNDFSVDIIVPINKDSPVYKDLESLYNKGIDITDPEDPFFTDFCFKFETENNTDMTLQDKIKNYLINNSTLCPKGYTYKGLNHTNNTSLCSYESKPIIKEDTFQSFKDSLINAFSNANWKVVTCIELIFTLDIFTNNYGSWFMIALIIISIGVICWIISSAFKALNIYFHKVILSKQSLQPQKPIAPINKTIKDKHRGSSNLKLQKQTHKHKKHPNSIHIHNSLPKNKEGIHQQVNRNKVYTNDDYYEMEFEDLNNDNRSIISHYWGFLRMSQQIIYVFLINTPRTPKSIKVSLFFMGLAIDFSVSAFFYSDKYISMNYNGNSNFLTDLPVSVYSSLITIVIGFLLGLLTGSETGIRKIEIEKNPLSEKEGMIKSFIKCYKLRVGIYIFIKVLIFGGLWYYTACFCAVYPNSQKEWLKTAGFGFGIGQAIPFIPCFVMTVFYEISLKCKNKCCYKIVKFINLFF